MNESPSLSLDVPGLTVRTKPFDLNGYDIPHSSPFLCDIKITQKNLSRAIDHVSNIEYLKWLDRAAELHSDSLGYTRRSLMKKGVMWFVARHEIDYLAEVWPNDRLVLLTWVRDMARVRSWRDYLIIREDDSSEGATPVCRAATLWVLVDLSRRKPSRIPSEMAQRFEPLDMHDSTTDQRATDHRA